IGGRFAWHTHSDVEHTIIVELFDDVFERYCPELLSAAFLSGYLRPQNYCARPHFAALAKMLARELDPAERRGRLFAESIARSLVLETALSQWTGATRTIRPASDDVRVKRAVDLIESGFRSDLSL